MKDFNSTTNLLKNIFEKRFYNYLFFNEYFFDKSSLIDLLFEAAEIAAKEQNADKALALCDYINYLKNDFDTLYLKRLYKKYPHIEIDIFQTEHFWAIPSDEEYELDKMKYLYYGEIADKEVEYWRQKAEIEEYYRYADVEEVGEIEDCQESYQYDDYEYYMRDLQSELDSFQEDGGDWIYSD